MSIRRNGLKVAFATAALTLMAGVSAQSNGPVRMSPTKAKAAAASTTQNQQIHMIVFREAPLATRRGGLSAAQRKLSSANGGKVDPKSASSQAYVRDLEQQQRTHVATLSQQLGHPIKIRQSMQHALNAVVVELTPAEAALVKKNPDVLLVEAYREYVMDTDAGPKWIGAHAVWANGTGLPANVLVDASGPSKGEGIVFGILDSGINFSSPSFAATDSQGYTHTNPLGAGNYQGLCAPGEVDAGQCNAKLIGAFDFVCGAPANACGVADITDEPSAVDNNGHGSHTASTAAGSHRDTTFRGASVHLSGVSPRANIVAYDICYTRTSTGQGLCPSVSAVAAVDQAVAGGIVDVINYSIGGGAAPWSESVSLAFLNASEAGIYVATSAGNSGPGAGTLGHNEPWTASTAAATHDRAGYEFFMTVTGPTPVPPELTSIQLRPGVGGISATAPLPSNTPVVVSPNVDPDTGTSNDGCNAGTPYPPGLFANSIAVIRRGGCAFSEKANNGTAAGAIAVVIANSGAAMTSPSVPNTTVPVYMITRTDANALRDFYLSFPSTTTASIGYPAVRTAGQPDVLAAFSSRGPAAFDVLKPDITGPGVQILAAVAGPAEAIDLFNGTSMSSPHNAGSAGLLRQLHPSWTVPEIKSALMMTAAQGVLLEDGVTPANAFAAGAGRLRPYAAARTGLVMNETTANYLAADPAGSGDPATLNQPSMARKDCLGGCTFTRTFRSARPHFQFYNLALEGLSGTVWPSRMFIWGTGERTVKVNINTSGITPGATWYFGKLVLTPAFAQAAIASPPLRLPIAVSVPKPLILITTVENISGAEGSQQNFPFTVPAGATSLVVKTSGGPGDADLYLFDPTPTQVCASESGGNTETCTVTNPVAGSWTAAIVAFTDFSGVTLTASYTN